jgi:hypothetical protein
VNAPPRVTRGFSPLLLLAGAVVAAWVWTCLCRYPLHDWNELRLAPSFMWSAGLNPYPGPAEGPVTTWVYGPVPILLQLPATLATSVVAALMSAAVINLLIVLVPLAYALRTTAVPQTGGTTRAWAFLLALAAWPAVNLIFCQADNAAVGLGLTATALLAGDGSRRPMRLWLAAGAATLALWSKQSEVGPVLGQLAWLAVCRGWRESAMQLGRCAVAGGLAGLVFCGLFGAEGLAYNMFLLPGAFPWIALSVKIADPVFRLRVLAYLIVYLAGPLALLIGCRRSVFQRESAVLLPALVFLFSVPFNLAGFLTVGGNVNSWHAAVYLLPAASLWLGSRPRFAVACLLVVLCFQVAIEWPLRWRPAVSGLRQGASLAAQLPGQVYFPWNPLPAYFADRRFDHAEDGLQTRAAAGRPVPPAVVRAYLPPHLSVVAYHGAGVDGYVRSLIPAGAHRDQFGEWTLYSWEPAP